MNPMTKLGIGVAAAVIVVGTFGAIASHFGFPYTSLFPLFYLIFGLAGFLAARRASLKASVGMGALAGAVYITVDSTIFWLIGTPRIDALPAVLQSGACLAVPGVCLIGAVLGLLGGLLAGLIGRITARSSDPSAQP
jgi:hypothetical protein